MESIKSTIDYLVNEGAVILDAPIAFSAFCIGIALLEFRLFSWWNRRELDVVKSTVENLKSVVQMADARIEGLITEAKNLKNALAETSVAGSATLAPVTYGNTAIQTAFQEVTAHPVTLYTFTPSLQSRDSPERLAAYKRLEETGLVTILKKDGTFSVTATPEAAKMYRLIDDLHRVTG